MNSASTIMVVSAGRLQFTLQRAPSSHDRERRRDTVLPSASPPLYQPTCTGLADARSSLASCLMTGMGWIVATWSFVVVVYAIVALPGLLD